MDDRILKELVKIRKGIGGASFFVIFLLILLLIFK